LATGLAGLEITDACSLQMIRVSNLNPPTKPLSIGGHIRTSKQCEPYFTRRKSNVCGYSIEGSTGVKSTPLTSDLCGTDPRSIEPEGVVE